VGIGCLSWGLSGKGVALIAHLAPRLKKEWSYTSIPHLGFHGLLWSEFYLPLFFLIKPTSLFAGAHPIKTLAKQSVTLSS
jgi:hypothetical protein